MYICTYVCSNYRMRCNAMCRNGHGLCPALSRCMRMLLVLADFVFNVVRSNSYISVSLAAVCRGSIIVILTVHPVLMGTLSTCIQSWAHWPRTITAQGLQSTRANLAVIMTRLRGLQINHELLQACI